MREWTAQDDEMILYLISKGYSRKEIGAHFGVTKSAVCGKVFRMNKPASPQMNPNNETIAAFEEINAGGGEVFDGSTEEIFDAIVASEEAGQSAPVFNASHNSGEGLPNGDAAVAGAGTFNAAEEILDLLFNKKRTVHRNLSRNEECIVADFKQLFSEVLNERYCELECKLSETRKKIAHLRENIGMREFAAFYDTEVRHPYER